MDLHNSISLNSLPSGFNIIYKLDKLGYFKYVSPLMASYLDMEVSEILHTSFRNLVRPDFRERVESFYLKQLESGVPNTYLEFPVVNSKGRESWIGQTVEIVVKEGIVQEVVAVACDVTEKITARQFAANSEEKYRGLIENIKLGLMEVDLNEHIVFANKSFCDITGYSLEEIMGKKASDLFLENGDSENHDKIADANQKRLEGESSAYEVKIQRKDGSPVWMIISGAPVRNSRGEIIGSVGIHNDITERKVEELERQKLLGDLEASNEELKRKQQYLSAVNEFAARLIKTSTIHEIVTEITQNTIEKFGFEDCVVYLLEEEGDTLSQIGAYGVKDRDGKVMEAIRVPVGKGIVGSVALSGKPEIVNDTSQDERYITDMVPGLSELAVPIIADGKTIGVIDTEHSQKNFYTHEHLETLVTISNLAANKIKSAVISQKREEAEAALKESETKLRAVIDSALDAMIIIDGAGIIQEWNPRARDIFGYHERMACGHKMTDLIIHQPFRRIMEMGIQAFAESGKAPMLNKRIEIQSVNRDGDIFPVEFSIVPVKLNGKVLYSAFARDITQQKKVSEEMINALNRERELNEMKSRLISMTSHEFRTPLTTIQTNIELLSYHLDREKLNNRPKLSKNFDRINSQIERLNVLMNDVLMMGRLESGKISNSPALTDVVKLCNDIIKSSFNQHEDGREVDFKVEGNARELLIDPNIYTHIITNLLSNAFKYSPDASNPALNLIFMENELRIEVIDSGIGIPEKDLPNIFDSFFRSDNAENIQGTGLGLAIVKEFCEMQGAQIEVESRLCWGSRFSITQPYQTFGEVIQNNVDKHTQPKTILN